MTPFPSGVAPGDIRADEIPEGFGLAEVSAPCVPLEPGIGAAQRAESGRGQAATFVAVVGVGRFDPADLALIAHHVLDRESQVGSVVGRSDAPACPLIVPGGPVDSRFRWCGGAVEAVRLGGCPSVEPVTPGRLVRPCPHSMHMVSELRYDAGHCFLPRHRLPFRRFSSLRRLKPSMRLTVGARVRHVGCTDSGRRCVDACGRSPRCRTLATTRAPEQRTSPVRQAAAPSVPPRPSRDSRPGTRSRTASLVMPARSWLSRRTACRCRLGDADIVGACMKPVGTSPGTPRPR
ncbi:hypothetical protein RKD27_004274 [Streptomyces sp. SAI-126]